LGIAIALVASRARTRRSKRRAGLRPAISNSVKAVIAHYNAKDPIIHRDEVCDQMQAQITSELQPYRVVVDSVNITDFHFSDEFAPAIERKQIAPQQATAKWDGHLPALVGDKGVLPLIGNLDAGGAARGK
jgi:regulator of protease activity HflC (stomatin/prohibitin superfamily)